MLTERDLDNPAARGAGDAYGALCSEGERLANAVSRSRQYLFDEFCESVPMPTAIVPTPGFGKSWFTVGEVITDSIAGRDGYAIMNELLRIVARAADGQDVRERANRWIAAQANRYADFHAADLAAQEGDE